MNDGNFYEQKLCVDHLWKLATKEQDHNNKFDVVSDKLCIQAKKSKGRVYYSRELREIIPLPDKYPAVIHCDTSVRGNNEEYIFLKLSDFLKLIK